MYEDIDGEKRATLLTKERSETDPLTGLLNRTTFIARVNHLLRTSKPGSRHALLMLDIDGFKQVNDVFGHGTGDQALVDIADGITSIVRRGDLVSRLGGDEFLVFLADIQNDKDASAKARQICDLTHKAFSMEVQISGSVGITIAPRDGTDFETLYKKVDSALYYVKGSGKNNYVFYRDSMADEHLLPETDAADPLKFTNSEKRRRMLIVDDSTVVHAMLQNIFKDEFIIETAKDGATALIRLRHYGSAISVVLLDLMMPGMDGFAVLKKMQQDMDLKTIPVLIVSGDESRETCLKAIRSGATDFITKPVDPDVLRIRVHSAVSKAENERLRAINSLLKAKTDERTRFECALESTGISFIEYDWLQGIFLYYPTISKYMST